MTWPRSLETWLSEYTGRNCLNLMKPMKARGTGRCDRNLSRIPKTLHWGCFSKTTSTGQRTMRCIWLTSMARKVQLTTLRLIIFLRLRKMELLRIPRRFSIKRTLQSSLMLSSKRCISIRRSGLKSSTIIDALIKRDLWRGLLDRLLRENKSLLKSKRNWMLWNNNSKVQVGSDRLEECSNLRCLLKREPENLWMILAWKVDQSWITKRVNNLNSHPSTKNKWPLEWDIKAPTKTSSKQASLPSENRLSSKDSSQAPLKTWPKPPLPTRHPP